MNTLIIFSTLLAVAISAPAGTAVNVQQSTDGTYTFHFMGVDASRLEERNPDGSVTGYYTFVDTDGASHVIHYSSGSQGFFATGADVPVPVQVLPEVAAAHAEHVTLVKSIAAELPPLGPDGLVPEVEPVPLTREEFLAAVINVLGKSRLTFVEDTPEIAQAKQEFLDAHKKALGF